MSKIRIHIRNVICASAQINGAKKEVVSARTGIRGTANFIDARIRSRDNLNNRLNQVCSRIDRIESQMGQIDRVVSNGANQYRAVEDQAVWRAKELSDIGTHRKRTGKVNANRDLFKLAGAGAASMAIGKKNLFVSNGKKAIDGQKKINRWVETLPKTLKNIVKAGYKKVTKGTVFEGSEKGYKIWSKIADGEYLNAVGEFVKEVGGQMYRTDAATGNTSFQWNAVKVQAAVRTVQLVLNEDGYIAKYQAKYETMAADAIMKGDLAGCAGAMVGEFVQTVGKGSVDVLCQTVGAYFDSTISMATGGMLTLSSINDLMYDVSGVSPGTVFNSITDGISKGVDFAVDKGMIQGGAMLSKGIGSAFSTSVHFVGSIFQK